MKALLFGSIGTLVETSEIQREAFNEAFSEHGLSWRWQRDEYQDMLATSGGRQRIENHANRTGETVDAEAIHRTKSRLFQEMLSQGRVKPREGVNDCIEHAESVGLQLGLVTTTSSENIDAIFEAISQSVSRDDFDLIVDVEKCPESKPNPSAYQFAIDTLGIRADQCLAIEDNTDGVAAAKSAGIQCIAFPGRNTTGHDYSQADATTNDLFGEVKSMLADQPAKV